MPMVYVDTEKLKKARERFKLADDADSPQQKRERDDQAFENGDQWPSDILTARAGQQPTNGMPAVPARPSLVINKVKEPVRQILNQERASDIGIELVPADDFGDLGLIPDDTEIKLREGLVRRIQRESNAADARTWAFKRAVIAGRGFYAVMTRYLPGKTSNQEVYVHRIYDQAGVLLDPSHESPAGEDADWEFLGTWMPWDRAKSEHPKLSNGNDNPFTEASEADFTSMAQDYPDWYQSDGDQRAVRVVQYWYRERKFRELVTLSNNLPEGQLKIMDVWADELDEQGIPEGFSEIEDSRRDAEDGSVIHYCKILGGVLEIESSEWAGPDMPIVKVLGDEVLPYDGKRRAEGVVRPARDPGMGENYLISKFIETVGLSPIPRDRIDPDAIEGYEPWWAVANTRTLPYLPYRSRDDQGNEFRAPFPGNVDQNILPIAQGINLFDGFIQQTTGGSAPDRLGVGQRVQADRAIKRLQEEEQFNTSNYLDNLTRSIRYEGQIENNLLYPIYGARPGRLARILTGEGESEMMVIGDPAQQQQAGAQRAKAQKMAKLTKDAHFNVIVKIAKNSDTRRDQFVAMFGDILSASPEQMLVGGDLFYKNMDIPEAAQLAKRMKLMLAPPIQAMLAQEESGQEPIPPAAQQQIGQLTERLKHAEAAMQELAQDREGKQLDAQTKLQVEQLKAAADLELKKLEADRDLKIQQMKDATAVVVARINAEKDMGIAASEATEEALALDQQHAHEALQAELDRQHEQQQATMGMAHEAAVGEGEQAHQAQMQSEAQARSAEQAEADRQFQAEQAEKAAQQTETE